VRAQAGLLGGHMKARDAVNAIAIEQRHRRKIQFRAARHKVLGQGCAFQEAEG